jgi:hypothetical protein
MKGLYKHDGDLMYAAISVNYPNGKVLTVSDYEGREGEIYDGWYWFNTRDEAKAALGVSDPVLPKPKIEMPM